MLDPMTFDPTTPEAIAEQRAYTAKCRAEREERSAAFMRSFDGRIKAHARRTGIQMRKRQAMLYVRQPWRLEWAFPALANKSADQIVAFAQINLERVCKEYRIDVMHHNYARGLLLFARFNRMRERAQQGIGRAA